MASKRGAHTIAVVISAIILLAGGGCSHELPDNNGGNIVLVSVGDSTLTMGDVTSRIPAGLTPEDSATLFSSIVESWMQDALLREMAEENLVDMEKIDRMAADYRNRLIVNEYMRQMERTDLDAPAESEIKSVYESEKNDAVTGSPLVKGVYIKLSKDAERLADVRRWVRSSSRSSLENIEKHGLSSAVEYDRFTDRWVDWEEVASQIPHSFGNGDEFLRVNRDFEISDRESTYLLHITEVLPSGSEMPYDFAASRIRESYNQRRRASYGRELVGRLSEEARKSGRLKTPGYDLKTHNVKTINTINQTKDKEK